MPLWPDIVVTKPDTPELLMAVEVKAGASARSAETQFKDYMIHQDCPIGMLVTPETTLFFRNPYTGYEPDAIRKIGECSTSQLLGKAPEGATEESLLRLVEHWLESLAMRGKQSWPPSAQEAIESYVLPEVLGGVVRATGPRLRRTGS